MNPITMQDIADRCGVSRATVSFALRNDPRITAKRRQEIQSVAKEMGYRPNPLINSLMTQLRSRHSDLSGRLIAMLSFHPDKAIYQRDSLYNHLFDGCKARASELGYAFDLIDASIVNAKPAHINRILATRGTTGVVIPPVPPGIFADKLDYTNLAVVKFGYTCPDLKCHRIAPFHAQAMRHTLKILRERGYQRIAFLFHEDCDLYTNYEYLAFASRHNLEMGDAALPLLAFRSSADSDRIKAYLLQYKPDIVIGDHSRVFQTIVKAGFAVPRDVEFCCLDTTFTQDQTAGFRQSIPELGSELINFLDNLIRHNRRGIPENPITLKVAGHWIDGPTMHSPAPRVL